MRVGSVAQGRLPISMSLPRPNHRRLEVAACGALLCDAASSCQEAMKLEAMKLWEAGRSAVAIELR